MISFYEGERARFNTKYQALDRKARESRTEGFINTDTTKIAWTVNLKAELARNTPLAFDIGHIVPSIYRPFMKQWLYFDRKLNERVLQIPRFFPHHGAMNRVIGVSAGESRSGSVLMSDVVPSLHAADMVGSQYFPLYVYEVAEPAEEATTVQLFKGANTSGTTRRDGITDAGLAHFKSAYPGQGITKEDLFYYVYGILHSPDYRERYADNLGKELPRIPRVATAADFWAFSKAGRALGDLHVGYEQVPEYAATIDGPKAPTPAQYRVEKMKFGKGKDKTVVHYNDFFTVRDIPLAAYEYVVNGKPAIEWVMERQSVTTDKDSGIVKDANAYATETVGDPRYPLSLLLRVITVSLETMKIVRWLPTLVEMPDKKTPVPYPTAEPEYLMAAEKTEPRG
jgi:predicted helicase